jgi:Zn ribbon nucleic-acid-binding protein
MECPKCSASISLSATIESATQAKVVCAACGYSSSLALRRAAPEGMRPADWVLSGFTVLGMIGLAIETASLRTFARMFVDFGGALPLVTQFVFSSWLPADLLALSAVLLAAGIALRVKSIAGGRALLVGALILSCASIPFVLFALYLPLLGLAGSIH